MTASSSGDPRSHPRDAPTSTVRGLALRHSAQGFLLGFRVRPGAASTRLRGSYGDRLKIDVAAPAVAGRANGELVRVIASWLGVPIDCVSLQSGHKSRDKVLAIRGIEEAVIRKRLDSLVSDG
jgi:uncharacterized protein (TIGR00251 family)